MPEIASKFLWKTGMESKTTENLTIKYDDLTAVQFIELWETVWGCGTFPRTGGACDEKHSVPGFGF